MKKDYYIYWNYIELSFLSPEKEDWYIRESFNYREKPFYITLWVNSLLNLIDYIELKQQLIYHNIINKIYEKSKVKDLDYLQKLNINGTKCWIIDNGSNICLMLPDEY